MLPAGTSRPHGHERRRYGGYGLSLLEGLSDKIDFAANDPQGTMVRVEKNLYYETQKHADNATARDNDNGGSVTANRGR